jgi:hypothetical protein
VLVTTDEGIRWPADKEKMSKLPLLKGEGGRITAALASQITDGSSAVLVVNERGLKKLNLKPRARIVAMALAGDDPVMMLSAPIPAARKVLKIAGLSVNDIDLWEINEAFASVPLACAHELKFDLNRLNVNGGAMALGHPLGGEEESCIILSFFAYGVCSDGNKTGHDAAARARAAQGALRPHHHLRGRGHCQRHHHRAPRPHLQALNERGVR